MKLKKYICMIAGILLFSACSERDEVPSPEVPEGMVEVRPSIAGMLTASPSAGNRTIATRTFTPDSTILADKKVLPLEEGATMWLLIDGKTQEKETYKTLKSYVVKGEGEMQRLYPCTVDDEGNVTTEKVAPLYIPYGTYTFKGISPARVFLDQNGQPVSDLTKVDTCRMMVQNGEYLISSDERYQQTLAEEQTIAEGQGKVQLVELKPLINQTAQLKFTLYADPNDAYIHSIEMLPAGVEISGLQDPLAQPETAHWNWSPALKDTLKAYPGNKFEKLILHGDDAQSITHKSGKELEVRASVLPTDAISTSVIVLFNIKVNDVPTQYEMMLNQKILRAAYSYHYKGKVTITDGIVAITWQHISWDANVGIEL